MENLSRSSRWWFYTSDTVIVEELRGKQQGFCVGAVRAVTMRSVRRWYLLGALIEPQREQHEWSLMCFVEHFGAAVRWCHAHIFWTRVIVAVTWTWRTNGAITLGVLCKSWRYQWRIFLWLEYWTASYWNASTLLPSEFIVAVATWFQFESTLWIPPSADAELIQMTTCGEGMDAVLSLTISWSRWQNSANCIMFPLPLDLNA